MSGFAGLVVLDSTVTFPATPDRPAGKFVDQGGDGVIFGARVGWGRLVTQHIYVGGEVEGLLPWNVTSRLNAYGVEYRARLRGEIGAFGRIGWSSDGRNLFFFRAGLVIPTQNFESVENGNRARTEWTPVPTFGIGAEIPLTASWAARMDVTYSWPSGVNVIESYRMNAGLVYRF
ncbi:hypothetical protein Rmf_40030 [Roseomonas fluvialis]|uniref:Outer membrane protein beta-barrel domain-containing protein n=1 Tax=Roseomonas fluvialis TaxID=1750527 RepID=A0ABM7Y7V8_9PROT|nr:hypothetical protein Rmf_40030 [Roseomonas fluvialis]